MVEHQFMKKVSPVVLESTKKAFEKLPPVNKLRLSRFELAINSIRRVLGDNFYDMTNSDFDLTKLVIDEMSSFNMESLKSNAEQSTNIVQMAANLIQQFAILNNGETTFTSEFMKNKVVKIAVTTPDGVKSNILSFEDFARICSFNDSNQVIGIRYIREITECGNSITQNDQAYNKMKQSNNTHAMMKLDEEREKLTKKLYDYNQSIVKNLFDIIKDAVGISDIKDVYDVMFIFDEIIHNGDPKDSDAIHVQAVFDMHDCAALNVVSLENKFHVNHEIATENVIEE